MAGFIPRNFINDLLARTDILDVIDSRVKLKKRGKSYLACCPFHQEKTPSFNVNPQKQFFHCFGCGESGSAIDFLMKYERLDFVEAIEELAASQGLEVPYEKRSNKSSQITHHQRQDFYTLMSEIALFYQTSLNTPIGLNARNYLEKRQLSQQVISRFSIGYAPRNQLIKQFGRDHLLQKQLTDLGMFGIGDNGSLYDRFRDRIMFPIRDKRGRVLGFGGRVLDDSLPKYLNSPETELFHKSRQLYGLYELLQDNQAPESILLVEGYMDVVALSQFEINFAVAALGTATTAEHIQLLFRHTERIICCYDGDRAGKAAAWRALQSSLPYLEDGREINFIFLPDGDDPDSIVRKLGKPAFTTMIETAEPFSNLLFETLLEETDISHAQGKTKLSSLAIPLIQQVPGFTHQLFLKKQLGNKLGIVDENQLEQIFFQYKQKKLQQNKVKQDLQRDKHTSSQAYPGNNTTTYPAKRSSHTIVKNKHLQTMVGLLIQNPALYTHVPTTDGFVESKIQGVRLFVDVIRICQQHPNINTAQLIHFFRADSPSTPEINQVENEEEVNESNAGNQGKSNITRVQQLEQIVKIMEHFAVWQHGIEEENIEDVFVDSLSGFYDQLLEQRLEILITKSRTSGNLSPEEQEEVKMLTLALR